MSRDLRDRRVAALSTAEAEELRRDIVYLNIQELKRLSAANQIPYVIHIERGDGTIVKSRDIDRKGIMIDRLRKFLTSGAVTPSTLFKRTVVSFAKRTGALTESDRALYGEYKNGDPEILRLMRRLTGGRFAFGAIAQEILRARWASGEAPTYAEFARLWLTADARRGKPHPEWAFLADLAKGDAGPDWKRFRAAKAARVLALVERATVAAKG